jgi:hypothetical protein
MSGNVPSETADIQQKTLVQIQKLADLILSYQTRQLQATHPNPLNRFGRKCFSETDEDGITLEILRRLGLLKDGVYAEFGVADGLQNNTLILASLGWKGFWVSGEDLAFKYRPTERFFFLKEWITLENIIELTRRGMRHIHAESIDVISLDLDGNDIYFAEKLLSGFRPKLYIAEYNAKFPPPVEFRIAYDPKHVWNHDAYFGASLSSFDKLFSANGYRLICCNAHSGVNAFFIDARYAESFADIPRDIQQIYVEPRYYWHNRYGHRISTKVVEKILYGNVEQAPVKN